MSALPQQSTCGKSTATISTEDIAALNDRLSMLGAYSGIAKTLLVEVLDVMVEMNFTMSDASWRTQGGNDMFVRTVLSDATGHSRPWDSQTYKGHPLLAFVRAINAAAHCTERTSGAQRLRDTVIYAQGGEYCALCGDRDALEVDHIDPVSVGGSPDAIANLQLLCSDCNGGKGAYVSRLLPTLLTPCTTDFVSAAVRFKCLVLTANPIRGRLHARCSVCGETSLNRRILVDRRSSKLAAGIFNVRTKCDACH
jgi:hypothetical protein